MSEEIVIKECPFCGCRAEREFLNRGTRCYNSECPASITWMTVHDWNTRPDSISALERNLITLVENWVDSPEGMYATSWQVSGILAAVGEIRKERASSAEN